MSELITVNNESTAITPMAMIQIAVQQGADIDKLTKLLDLQERYETRESRKAFVSAMSAFKLNPPEIFKNKHVKFGNTEYDHATLDNVSIAIGESLSKQGLSHRWNTSQADGKIKVTCVITHNMGHSEEVSLESVADTSGAKNSIQAIGSAVTYLQRYTLLAATGMAVQDQDDDGSSTTTTKPVKKSEKPAIQPSDDLSDEEKRIASEAAAQVVKLWAEGKEVSAYEAVYECGYSNEVFLAIWGLLRPHSHIRTALKKMRTDDVSTKP